MKRELKFLYAVALEMLFGKYAKNWPWLAKYIKSLRGFTEREYERWLMKNNSALRKWVYATYGPWCLRCLYEFGIKTFATDIDHIKALYNGGKTVKDNLQPLCNACNLWKGTRTIDYRGKVPKKRGSNSMLIIAVLMTIAIILAYAGIMVRSLLSYL